MSLWGTQLDARAHQYSNLKQYAPRFLWPFVPRPGKDNETSCNLFARDFLDSCFITDEMSGWANGIGGLITVYNFDIRAIHPGVSIGNVILNTTIQECHKNLETAVLNGKIKRLTAEQAQARANEGIPIHAVSGKYNHEAIVTYDPNKYDSGKGPLLVQAGSYCGILYLGDKKTFGAYGLVPDILKNIGFYEYPGMDKCIEE